jgi:Zn-dependent membrane protease YugP
MIIWILLIIVPLLFGLYAQMRVSSAYRKNVQIPSRRGVTGREAAAAVMQSAGIHDVEIVRVEGELTDHYDPSKKRLALSEYNYDGTSLAALGVAAHEAGHAIQDKVGYSMMNIRQTLVPMTQIASGSAQLLEFDATRRAKAQLVNLRLVDREEMPGVNQTLDAAALTYVAAFISSLGSLIHILMLIMGGRRDE